jgi:hypothetical protein
MVSLASKPTKSGQRYIGTNVWYGDYRKKPSIAMCEKCDEIDETIARYKRLVLQTTDRQAAEAALRLIEELESRKQALHTEE